MRRDPEVVDKRWLELQKRRGYVRRERCEGCGKFIWIPEHLFGVQRSCERCESLDEAADTYRAAEGWRRWNTLSPLIEGELERG